MYLKIERINVIFGIANFLIDIYYNKSKEM